MNNIFKKICIYIYLLYKQQLNVNEVLNLRSFRNAINPNLSTQTNKRKHISHFCNISHVGWAVSDMGGLLGGCVF